MTKVVRFGVSMDAELLSAFDRLIAREGYENRSEALRDLVRRVIVEANPPDEKEPVVAALCLMIDPAWEGIASKLARLKDTHADKIVTDLRVLLDDRRCMEVLVLRGPGGSLRALAGRFAAIRGVLQSGLTLADCGGQPT